jgi:hypothetical protein
MNFGFAELARLELGLALVRVEPVLLGREQLVLVHLAAAALGVVARAGFPGIGDNDLQPGTDVMISKYSKNIYIFCSIC